jgi:hypothetical protein
MRSAARTSAPFGPRRTGSGRSSSRAADLEAADAAIHDFGSLRITPLSPAPGAARDIPVGGEPETEVVDQPTGGLEGTTGTTAGGGTATPATSCDQPLCMNKLLSGPFLGGLTMDSYYPDLAGKGYYEHPGTGGPFDTGSRVGGNVQLYGVIPSPCSPQAFRLAQTVTRTRYRRNGVIHPEEGKTFDDIAKSGRDASRPPFRQEFLGGGAAPLGYIISMADPPSTGYSGTADIEHDRDFVTSLVGPGGTQRVQWSLSTRVTAGQVTKNALS